MSTGGNFVRNGVDIILTLYMLIFQMERKHTFTFYVITPHRYDTGNLKSFLK